MRKNNLKRVSIVLIVLGTIIVCLFSVWGASVIKCEILTSNHKEDFREASAEIAEIMKFDDWKVLKYSQRYAEVYYYSDGGGAVISYDQINGTWVERTWEATWSATGSADDIIWPYIR